MSYHTRYESARSIRVCRSVLAAGVVALAATACSLDVTNPSVIDADRFNPNDDGEMLSLSAQTLFFGSFQTAVQSGALLSEELWSGAAAAEPNDVSRRTLNPVNLQVNSTVFSPLSRAFVTNDEVVNTLTGGTGAESDVNLARAAMNAAFSLVFQAEYMCSGVMRQSAALTPDQLLDSAIVRFQKAVAVGTAASATGAADGGRIVNASNVGMARAQLQRGDLAAAVTSAALVQPGAADYAVITIDDAANRSLGNNIFSSTTGRTISVPALYQITDTRIPWTSTGRPAQDATLTNLVAQLKYGGFASPLRIASYLEARYIAAEARLKQGDAAAALALIEERTAPAVAGAAATALTSSSTIGRLMELRAREFWLEGKKLGDIRRNPDARAYYQGAGAPFYKGTSSFGSDVCFPIPQEETNTNPNLG